MPETPPELLTHEVAATLGNQTLELLNLRVQLRVKDAELAEAHERIAELESDSGPSA